MNIVRIRKCSRPYSISPVASATVYTDRYEITGNNWETSSLKSGGNLKKEATKMDFRPLHDRILVERIESEEKSVGGIILPDTAKEKPQQGKVISVGPGKRTEDGTVLPLTVKEGDKILFGKYSGSDIKLDGTEYLILKEDDVLGLIEE
jgi:chaperonin GroES